ncbi:MAG: hypothetical protein ACFE0O_14495 [Opitutales bacterium]
MKYWKLTTLFLFLALGVLRGSIVAPDSHTTFCEGQVVQLSDSVGTVSVASGTPCCDANGDPISDTTITWTAQGTAHVWSGDISGGTSGATADLDTSTTGNKSVELEMTTDWECQTGTTGTGSDEFSATYEVVAQQDGLYDSGNVLLPTTLPNDVTITVNGIFSHIQKTEPYYFGTFGGVPRYGEKEISANLVDVSFEEEYEWLSNSTPQFSPGCGNGLPADTTTVGAFSFGISIAYKALGVSATWSGAESNDSAFSSADHNDTANIYKTGKKYKILRTLISGTVVDYSYTVYDSYGVEQWSGTEPDSATDVSSEIDNFVAADGMVNYLCCSS